MSWEKWVLIGLFAYSTLVTIGQIGKPRKAVDPRLVITVVLVNAGLAALVIFS